MLSVGFDQTNSKVIDRFQAANCFKRVSSMEFELSTLWPLGALRCDEPV